MQVLKQLQIPYSFAKRHGVLLRYEGDQAFIIRREQYTAVGCTRSTSFSGAFSQLSATCTEQEV